MKSTFLLLCIISLCASCSSTDHSEEEKTELPIPPQSPVELNVTLNMTQATFKIGMPITLRFVLKNNGTEAVTFCKLNSPANELVWNNCFRVTDDQNNNIAYIGKTPQHSGPIEDKHLMTIEADGIRLYTIDIRTLYQLDKPGKYSLRFMGDKINLLPNSYPVNFVLE